MDGKKKYSVKEYFSKVCGRKVQNKEVRHAKASEWTSVSQRDSKMAVVSQAGPTIQRKCCSSTSVGGTIYDHSGSSRISGNFRMDPRQAAHITDGSTTGKKLEIMLCLQNKNVSNFEPYYASPLKETFVMSPLHLVSHSDFSELMDASEPPIRDLVSSSVNRSCDMLGIGEIGHLSNIACTLTGEQEGENQVTSTGCTNEEQEIVLPPYWKSAKDSEGHVYYYHQFTRKSQWHIPSLSDQYEDDDSSSDEDGTNRALEMGLTIALLDTAESEKISEAAENKFRSKIFSCVTRILDQGYRKVDSPWARITNSRDFKYLAEKLTNSLMVREVKLHKKNKFRLKYSKEVKCRATKFINKYMVKFGLVYRRTRNSIVSGWQEF